MRHTNRATQPRSGNRYDFRDDYADKRREVRRLRRQGVAFREIARRLDIGLATAHRYADA